MIDLDLGASIPPHTAHAVSVSLPTWKSNIGYEEGEDWVVGRMVTGYPRFFIHRSIQAFIADILDSLGRKDSKAFLFPTRQIADRCVSFVKTHAPPAAFSSLSTAHLVLDTTQPTSGALAALSPAISAVLCSQEAFPFVKQYWQHTGDGVSSRRAEFCHNLFKDGLLRLDEEGSVRTTQNVPTSPKPCRGPKRYQRPSSVEATKAAQSPKPAPDGDAGLPDLHETSRFLEERYGRNLDVSFVHPAKSAIKRRIAGALRGVSELTTAPPPEHEMESNSRGIPNLKEEDVYLFPCGMSAIFNSHRALLSARGSMKSVNFGFPYVDTFKVLEKFGPGAVFYGHGSEEDLDDLEKRLQGGDRFLALFCEFPGNPLLTCPNLVRIRQLADKYDFAVVVDETIGTFANVNVLPFADIVASSLTKIFSGDCNVMGGSAIFNPNSRYYSALKEWAEAGADGAGYEDTYWPEDVMFMERNSRDFASRIDRINTNAEAICDVLRTCPIVKTIFYPKYNTSRANYEACQLPGGGYGGLLSVVFHRPEQAVVFYDVVETAKGPSLGTNFTLTSPYVLLAHYQELDWAEGFGVDRNLIRISVGLEETDHLVTIMRNALETAAK
ncbi:pyridoxal phosphate-dependent transferase [Dichotomopilus funicola]|uniref:cystathionine gamma-synthase n=1 Tax=Dichotomopilus funicola TaxID=1934379 RepID=A0AAN6UW13_9PEZI|nr:pyridoxal phosphate-dependent transferase [Dichotomopilus funicola]